MSEQTTATTIAEEMGRLGSYPNIYGFGHAALGELLEDDVLVEEKVDGSQFSFGITADGVLRCRSKGAQLVVEEPEQMFRRGVETALALQAELRPGWVYRGEYLQKPKHNTLKYDRVPREHVILFDVETGVQEFLSPAEKASEAERLGLEVVPIVHMGRITSAEQVLALLGRESCLGGAQIEGVVIKNYQRYGKDKKVLMAKYVSDGFKEVHGKEWKAANPTKTDVVQMLVERYRTEARWRKAVQHLREAGTLEGSPRDIGALIREIPADIRRECEEEIKAELFAHVWPQIARASTAGMPEWYKRELLASAFGGGA